MNENLEGLVAAYEYYDKKIAEVECDTIELYMKRTGNPVNEIEFDALKCEALNDLEHHKNIVAKAIDNLVDKLDELNK